MINRLLIRIKIIQLVYAHLQNNDVDFFSREELMRSMESAYKLYNYLLALIVKITDYRYGQLETARNKYMPTAEERCPNTRFVDNRIADMLKKRSGVVEYCEKHQLTNDFDTDTYRTLLNEIIQSPFYQAYMECADLPDFDTDKELWKNIFNTIIPNCEKLDDTLEEKDIYWNDDLCIVTSFVVKTLQKMRADDETIRTLPMFRSDEDRLFAIDLFEASLSHANEYLKLIDQTANNWEVNRMACMDRIIMVCAIAEIMRFPEIPIQITLNEYIELAKNYSTPTSAKFINGILDRIVKNLQEQGVIFKA